MISASNIVNTELRSYMKLDENSRVNRAGEADFPARRGAEQIATLELLKGDPEIQSGNNPESK